MPECSAALGSHGRGGLEDASSRSKTTCVVQRDANEWREATGILRSGNTPAPKASGWPRAKPEPRSGRKSPRDQAERKRVPREAESAELGFNSECCKRAYTNVSASFALL